MSGDKVTLQRLERFFFEAMMAGYAGGNNGEAVKGRPGHAEIVFERGELRCVDEWTTDPKTNKSAGQTTIEYKNRMLWLMSYGGYYPREVLDFLRAALRATYEVKRFNGGRGPLAFTPSDGRDLIYVNAATGSFSHFEACERIVYLDEHGREKEVLGQHKCWGMALI